jgi:hypothetical protein
METVTEKKVLEQEELQTLKSLQEETQALVLEFGEIEMISLQLEERKNKAKTFLSELTKKEQDFTQNVFQKYGKCNVNPKTGEITLIS